MDRSIEREREREIVRRRKRKALSFFYYCFHFSNLSSPTLAPLPAFSLSHAHALHRNQPKLLSGLSPHEDKSVYAQAAQMNRIDSIRFDSIQFKSTPLNSIRLDSVRNQAKPSQPRVFAGFRSDLSLVCPSFFRGGKVHHYSRALVIYPPWLLITARHSEDPR